MLIQTKEILELVVALGGLLTLVASVAVNYSTWQAKGVISDIHSEMSDNQRDITAAQQDLAKKQQEMAKTQQSFLRHYQEFTRKVIQNTNHNLVAIGATQQGLNDVRSFLAKHHNFVIKQDFPTDSIPDQTDFTP